MRRQKFNEKSDRLRADMKFVKLALASIFVLLLLALPAITTILTRTNTFDSRSRAQDDLGNSIRSWVVSPNGDEIVYGNTAIQFYARSSSVADAQFSFTVDLYKDDTFYKNLFIISPTENPANRDGIYTKYVDLTGYPESSKYKLKLTTADPSGKNAVADYSDKYFTISPNSSKPEFTSKPPANTIYVGDTYDYTVSVTNPSTTKVTAAVIPSWLSFNGIRLTGKAPAEDIYSVNLVATNSAGRQTSQVFSINVRKRTTSQNTTTPVVTAKPTTSTPKPTTTAKQTPTQAPPTSTPVTTVKPVENTTDKIIVQFPAGDNLSSANSKIISVFPAGVKERLTKIVVEISTNARDWSKVYEGIQTEFNLDITAQQGGEHYFRFTYTFHDNTKEVVNYGPVNIIQSQPVELLTIDTLKPGTGDQTTETRPAISAIFQNKSDKKVDTKQFKFLLNDRDLTLDPNTRVSETSFSYIPPSALGAGMYTVHVEVSLEGDKKVVKEWKFEIKDPALAAASTAQAALMRKLVLAAILIVIALFIIGIWAVKIMKKEVTLYTPDDDLNRFV